ncbi:MAG: serine/threonine-protein kinase [Sandaracinaceae bacterium]
MTHTERRGLRNTVIDGRYHLLSPIGLGGTAVVFAAERVTDGRAAVVKVLRDAFAFHRELTRRLRREGEVARRVRHPGVVRFIDDGWLDDGSPYLVLERIRGECLARILRRHGPLPAELVAAIVLRVTSILHAAHQAGYVHRDVKPEHIVLDRRQDGRLDVRLLDFGVCAAADAPYDEREGERGRVYGTPSYASPEQAAGRPDVDARADVFSLGTVMFEALTGRLPFRARSVSRVLRQIIVEDAPRVGLLMPDLDLRMDEVVTRAMARIPHRRYASARALGRALMAVSGDRLAAERSLVALIRRRAGSPSDHTPTVPRPDPDRVTQADRAA